MSLLSQQFWLKRATTGGVSRHWGYLATEHILSAQQAGTDKLVVTNLRGEGTSALLDVFDSGFEGCVATIYSVSVKATIEKLVAYADIKQTARAHAHQQISRGVHLVVRLVANHLGEQVVGEVSQVVGLDEQTGRVVVQQLWELGKGDKWASPVRGFPDGRIGQLYRSAGLSLDDETGELTLAGKPG